jgi:hypothetical protein
MRSRFASLLSIGRRFPMLGRGRIGLTAVLVAALIALGASPAYAAKTAAGVITSGNGVTLLNTPGFVKVTLNCRDSSIQITAESLGGPLDFWADVTNGGVSNPSLSHTSVAAGATEGAGAAKPSHVEWSVSGGSKVALGQVYVAEPSGGGKDCVYTSQVA